MLLSLRPAIGDTDNGCRPYRMRTTSLTHRLLGLTIVVAIAATTLLAQEPGGSEFTVVSSFDVTFINGLAPSSLQQGDDGAFYGTTSNGGLFGQGVLFRMDSAGVVTVLNSFSGNDGAQPFGLVRASDGRLYGLTADGGEFGEGTIFRFVPGGALTTLHSFSEADRFPVDLFAAGDGNVYGLTRSGGVFGNGTIFVIDPAGNVTTVHSVAPALGTSMTSLVRAADRFYVAARFGGDGGQGTLFAVPDTGPAAIIHSFSGLAEEDGDEPNSLMLTRDGRLYGTTRFGGQHADGTVFTIDSSGSYSVLHSFDVSDTAFPVTDLLEASDGQLYGSTQFRARLFRIDSSGTLTLLNTLGGLAPVLIQGTDGRVYGPTVTGGPDDGGTIFARDPAGTFTTLYQFRIGQGAGRPHSVIQTRDGQFYGTTSIASGSSAGVTVGTVFAMAADGTRTTLHEFRRFASALIFEGTPISSLFEDADGSLYGTTFNEYDPPIPPGQIYRITPTGDFTTIAVSHSLRAGVIRARDGRLYGTTAAAADPFARRYGSVFRVEANSTLTSLHLFDAGDSANPVAELVEIDDGSLYGTTIGSVALVGPGGPPPPPVHGTIFRLDPATGSLTTRYRFTGPDGSKPLGRLIQATDGLIYGTTSAGGAFGFGTVFSLDAAGTLTTLHHFAGPDGANPGAGVIQGLDGRFYGTTTNGGRFNDGTVFVMDATGALSVLHDLAFADGARPDSELIQASDGDFYGVASAGGPTSGGVIFRVHIPTTTAIRYFELVSRSSGKCLDVYGASTDPAAAAIQWTCHGGLNQQWRLEPTGSNAFRIIARHSEQALDVYGALVDDLTPIIQYPTHGGNNQVWTLEPTSDGYVRIIALHSGKAIDVEGASTDDGARVIQYTPHGGTNQQWLLRAAD